MNMISKSIRERSILEAHAYNTLKDYAYFKNCPKQSWKLSRIMVMNGVSEYKRLRACFDNYQDKKTLKRDKKRGKQNETKKEKQNNQHRARKG